MQRFGMNHRNCRGRLLAELAIVYTGILFVSPVAAQLGAVNAQELIEQAAAQPTPRTDSGKPDLGGYWNGPPSVPFQ